MAVCYQHLNSPLRKMSHNKLKKRWLTPLLVVSIIALTACGGGGGGGGGGGNSPLITASILSRFNDGAGVGRIVSNSDSDSTHAVFIGPRITEFVAELNQQTANDLVNTQLSDFPITDTTSTANIREGTYTSDGTTINAYFVVDIDNKNETYLGLLTGTNARILLAGGTAYGGAPPPGEYTYSGTQGIGRRSSTSITSVPELGTFSLTANFGDKTFGYSGSSTNSSVSGSGIIDTVNGRFATSNLTIQRGSTYTGTMHGLLHGSSSESVSGVFHTNDNSQTYVGGFVGSR